MFAIFIQGPGSELRFLALRSSRADAEAALTHWAAEIGRDEPQRACNAFIAETDYFYVAAGKAERVPSDVDA